MRFSQTDDAFYILSFDPPSEKFVLDVQLPILPGDKVTMIGYGKDTVLEWEAYDTGIEITVPKAVAALGEYCWVIKIQYR